MSWTEATSCDEIVECPVFLSTHDPGLPLNFPRM